MNATADASAQGVAWDLSFLFSSLEDPRIAESWAEAHRLADKFAASYRGRTAALGGAELARAIEELEQIYLVSSKPGSYASLVYAADASDPRHGAFYAEQAEKGTELNVKLVFFELEIQGGSDEWAEAAAAAPEMAKYRHYLATTRMYSPHRLSEPEEVLIEEAANTGARAWVRLHDEILSNHKFAFHDPESGEAMELSQEEVLHRLRHQNRAVRQAAADSLSAGLEQLNRVICFAYNTLLADKKLGDRLRRYSYPEQSRHMANELDKETVDLVTGLCRDRSGLVARYYRVKREILGLPELTHIDRYAPLLGAKAQADWAAGRRIVEDSFRSFSPEMADRASEFFDKSWIDASPRKGKTGGAFCSYVTPDTHPVVLMTYQGTMDNVMTLAHELGHGVHASFSREQSLVNYHGTLPLAELASIFGEMLVFDKVTGQADAKDKLALYGEKIEGIFASVHRQAAMFRFEQRCHAARRETGELSSEQFGEIWQDEMQSMFEDSVVLGSQHKQWWSYVGHFFFAPFYVYAYSFGELLTLSLYQKAKAEGPAFAEKYVDVLKRGGSETPHELMARLGVDLRDRGFWEGGFAAIDRLVTEFESVWAEVKAQG